MAAIPRCTNSVSTYSNCTHKQYYPTPCTNYVSNTHFDFNSMACNCNNLVCAFETFVYDMSAVKVLSSTFKRTSAYRSRTMFKSSVINSDANTDCFPRASSISVVNALRCLSV